MNNSNEFEADIISNVEEKIPQFEEKFNDCEDTNCLPVEVIGNIVSCGFARYFVPNKFGGINGGFLNLAKAIERVGYCCASAAWCAMIFATSSRMASYLPAQTREKLWSHNPDVNISASLVSSGSAKNVDGGWILNGKWRFLSGVDHAQWSLIAFSSEEDGNSTERYCIVNRENYSIIHDWDVLGMRGTGTNSIVLNDVYVPYEDSFLKLSLLNGKPENISGDLYEIPLVAAHPHLFVASSLGAARALLDVWINDLKHYGVNPQTADTLAQSSAELDCASFLIERASLVCDEGNIRPLFAARNARDAAFAADLIRHSSDRIFRAGSLHAQINTSKIQRLWRDIQTATSHAAIKRFRNDKLYSDSVFSEKSFS